LIIQKLLIKKVKRLLIIYYYIREEIIENMEKMDIVFEEKTDSNIIVNDDTESEYIHNDDTESEYIQHHEPSNPPNFVMPLPIDEQLMIIDKLDEEYEQRRELEDKHEQLIKDMKLRVRVLSLLTLNKDPLMDIRYMPILEQKKLLKIMNSYSDTPFSTICEEFNEKMCDMLEDTTSKYECMSCYDDTLKTKYDPYVIQSVEPMTTI